MVDKPQPDNEYENIKENINKMSTISFYFFFLFLWFVICVHYMCIG